MLKELSGVATSQKLKAYISFEEHMACGIGACLGCAVEVTGKKISTSSVESSNNKNYKKVCTDGPVFNVEDIIW